MIAEYEKAKIAERYRRGKLFRARAGEIITWKAPYGYRRIARSPASGAGAPGDLRARGRGRAADLHRTRRRHTDPRDLPPTSTPTACPRRPAGRPGALHDQPAAAQRGLHRPGLLQPHRIGPRPPSRTTQPAGAARPRGVDRDRLSPHRHRRAVPHRRPSRRRQHQVEPTPRRTRPVAAQGPGQVRRLPRRHQLPQDARPQRHLAPLLLLPQPRPAPRRRRIPPLPRTQHPRRRPRRVRVRPRPRRAHRARATTGRRTSRHADPPDPRRRTTRRRTRPARPQDRRHRPNDVA